MGTDKTGKNGNDHRNQELLDTTKALIELYKSAFGKRAEQIFAATIKLEI
jgi:hypothetical protein